MKKKLTWVLVFVILSQSLFNFIPEKTKAAGKWTQVLQQSNGTTEIMLKYGDRATFHQERGAGEFEGQPGRTEWAILGPDFNAKLYLILHNDTVEEMCFAKGMLSQDFLNAYVNYQGAATKKIVYDQAKYALGIWPGTSFVAQSEFVCVKDMAVDETRAGTLLVQAVDGLNTSYLTLLRDIWGTLHGGDDKISFNRNGGAPKPETKDKCKKLAVKPLLTNSQDRNKFATQLKEDTYKQVTAAMSTTAPKNEEEKTAKEEGLRILKAAIDEAANKIKNNNSYSDTDSALYAKYYASDANLGYPNVMLTENLYQDFLEEQQVLERKMGEATVQLTDNQERIRTGLNIAAGVGLIVISAVALPVVAGAAGIQIGASLPTTLAFVASSHGIPMALSTGLGWGVAGLITAAIGVTGAEAGIISNELFNNKKGAIEYMFKNHFDDLFKLYMTGVYTGGNNEYNKCAAAEGDEWALVNDKVAGNIQSVTSQAQASFASAAVSYTKEDQVCGVIKLTDPVLKIGKTINNILCIMVFWLHDFANGFTSGAENAFRKIVGLDESY